MNTSNKNHDQRPGLPTPPRSAFARARDAMTRRPRNKWFASATSRPEEGWYGPHNTIEQAVIEVAAEMGSHGIEEGWPVYVAQGRKLTKAEMDDYGAEYEWEVDSQNAFRVIPPNDKEVLGPRSNEYHETSIHTRIHGRNPQRNQG